MQPILKRSVMFSLDNIISPSAKFGDVYNSFRRSIELTANDDVSNIVNEFRNKYTTTDDETLSREVERWLMIINVTNESLAEPNFDLEVKHTVDFFHHYIHEAVRQAAN